MSNENSIEGLLNIETISIHTLKALKEQVFGEKGGRKRLEDEAKKIETSIKKIKDERKLHDSYLALGICFLVMGKIDNALEILDNIKPKEKAYFFIGKCHSTAGNYKEALEFLELAAKKDADNYDINLEIASVKRKSGDVNDAKKFIEEMIKKKPDDSNLYYELGHCLDDIGKKEKAFDAYEKALELYPDNTPALFRIAYNYDLNQMDDEAIELYEMCNSLPVKYASSFINLGLLYDDRGENEKAIECFETVLESDPNNERVQMYLKDSIASIHMHYDESDSKRQTKSEDVLSVPISEFELSVRSRNCLEKMEIHTLGDLTRVSEQDLLSYKNFGETSLYEIRSILKQKGLRLGQSMEKPMESQIMLNES